MKPEVEAGPVDWGLESSFVIALETIVRSNCSQIEAARVRLAIKHPSPRLKEVIAAAHEAQLTTLYGVVAAVLNEALGLNPGVGL